MLRGTSRWIGACPISKSFLFIIPWLIAAAGYGQAWPNTSHWRSFPGSDHGCNQMAVGPSHDVWFCDTIGHSIDSISPHGDVTAYPGLPGHEPAMGIVGGPDGNIWYGARGGGVVRMTPSGSSTFFSIAMGIRIIAMTVGSDENIWAIGYNLSGACGCLVKITTSGRITIYPPQNGSDQLLSIATRS